MGGATRRAAARGAVAAQAADGTASAASTCATGRRRSGSAGPGAPRAQGVALASLALAGLVAAPAAASPDTLRRSFQNIAFAPLDVALAPLVAANTLTENLQHSDDSTAVRTLYVLPGFAWNTGVQSMAAVVREIAGLLELVPGLALFFFERDLEPLFDPAERGRALIDVETRLLDVRVGVDYTTLP